MSAAMVPVIRLLLLLAGAAIFLVGCAVTFATVVLLVLNWGEIGRSVGTGEFAGILVPAGGLVAAAGYLVHGSAKGLKPPGRARRRTGGFPVKVIEVEPGKVTPA
ncbi:MAG: hypothetical protein JWO31_3611 [Phycisphaerales bacterium]|nr:hypothetical protein [Phycisphaerales bacterium]